MGYSYLMVPDAHVRPGQDLRRFQALGAYVNDLYHRLDGKLIVIQQGDWNDMNSVSDHTEGRFGAVFDTWKADCAASEDSLQRFQEALGGVDVEKHLTLGNHGQPRLDRFLEKRPQLQGAFDYARDCKFEDYGWTTHKFLDVLLIDGKGIIGKTKAGRPKRPYGVAVSHYFSSGVMGKAIGGVNMARSLVSKTGMSCIVGHAHTFDMSRSARPDGTAMVCMSTGVFCDPEDPVFAWSKGKGFYWPGVVLVKNIRYGDYDIEQMSLDELLRRYGR